MYVVGVQRKVLKCFSQLWRKKYSSMVVVEVEAPGGSTISHLALYAIADQKSSLCLQVELSLLFFLGTCLLTFLSSRDAEAPNRHRFRTAPPSQSVSDGRSAWFSGIASLLVLSL